MANYMGKRRLKSVLFCYLNERPEITFALRRAQREYGEEHLFFYKKFQGSEWLEARVRVKGRVYEFHMCVQGTTGKRISLKELESVEDREEKVTWRGYAYYNSEFKPIAGDGKLFCESLEKVKGKIRK